MYIHIRTRIIAFCPFVHWWILTMFPHLFCTSCALNQNHVPLSATPWTVAHQPPLSMTLSRQEYWSGLPFPSPGHRRLPGMELVPGASPALAGRLFTPAPPGSPSRSSLLWIRLKWTWLCRHIFVILFAFLVDKYPEVGLPDHLMALFLIFWENSIEFSLVTLIYILINSEAHLNW